MLQSPESRQIQHGDQCSPEAPASIIMGLGPPRNLYLVILQPFIENGAMTGPAGSFLKVFVALVGTARRHPLCWVCTLRLRVLNQVYCSTSATSKGTEKVLHVGSVSRPFMGCPDSSSNERLFQQCRYGDYTWLQLNVSMPGVWGSK